MSGRLATLLFRVAMHALPRSLRDQSGEEMLETFREALRQRTSRRARIGYALRATADAVRSGFEERWYERTMSRQRRPKVSSFWHDARLAARSLMLRTPGFTTIAVVTLALGIGANVSIFSVVNAVLLRPLPFAEPERLVQIWESRLDQGWSTASFTHGNFWDVKDLNHTFTGIAGLRNGSTNLTGIDYPERLSLAAVSANFFATLGVQPRVGRLFASGEDAPGADGRQVILAHGLWLRRFGGDDRIVGKTITLDGNPYAVVGVLPRGEPWLNEADVFVPMVRGDGRMDRSSFELAVIGRLAPGVTVEAAYADLSSVAKGIVERFPEAKGMGVTINPSTTWMASDGLRRALWILMGAVGFLLLIACVNLANLSLARATGRARERALRSALGAGKGALVRQAFTESLVLSVTGAAAGLGLSAAVLSLLRSLDPGGIPRLSEVSLSLPVLGFTALATLVTALLTGIIPAVHAAQGDLGLALREGGRSVGVGRGLGRVRSVLVAIEVSASLALLIGAGLLLRSFTEVLGTNRGFQTADRILAGVAVPRTYSADQANQLIASVTERLSAQGGVTAVGGVSMRPLRGAGTGLGFAASDKPAPPAEATPWAGWRVITRDYFKAMGVPLLRGRDFVPSDLMGKPWRIIISRRIAEQLWPGEEAVGKTLIMWKGQGDTPAEVIGVVGDMRDWGLAEDPTYAVYFPAYDAGPRTLYFVIHGPAGPEQVQPALRRILAEIDGTIPLASVERLEDLVGESVASRRFIMLLLAAFAGVALLLSLAGVYGVLSYAVSRRTAEIGVRLALGANPRAVVRLIVAQGMRPVVVGLLIGVALALALSRLMTNLLFGISPTDTATFAGVSLLLGGAAVLSCYVPARQALGVDVVAALRKE